MRINTNVAALNSYNQLNNTNNNLSKSLERLSSGKRINGAADDAAGLAISEKMGSQTRGLAQAQRNAQDGISMIQTAEGALKESHSILQRMRELSVQSANDTNTADDRAEIQKEIDQLSSELNRIGNTTEFNTKNLLNGDLSSEKTDVTGELATSGTHTLQYSKVASWTGNDGDVPSINDAADGTGTDGQVDFSGSAGEFDWTTVDLSGGSGTADLTVERSGDELLVNFSGADSSGDTLTIDNEKVAVNDGAYSYDANGITFSISEEEMENFEDGAKLTLDLTQYSADSGHDIASEDVSTSSDYNQTTVGSGTVGGFSGDITIDGSSSELLDGVSQMKVSGSDLQGSGTITVTLTDGTNTIAQDTFSTNTSGGLSTFSYDEHGISFDFNAESGTTDFDASLDLETVATTEVSDESADFQIGANQNQSMTLNVNDMRAEALGVTGEGDGYNDEATVTDGTDNTAVENSLDVTSAEGAANAIEVLDGAISNVSAERSKLGAIQNRLDHTINNLNTAEENLTAAESRISDVDMAKEMMNMSKQQILSQAGTAMMAQANQLPQGVLQLLG